MDFMFAWVPDVDFIAYAKMMNLWQLSTGGVRKLPFTVHLTAHTTQHSHPLRDKERNIKMLLCVGGKLLCTNSYT